MRTTVDLPDELYRKAKSAAALRGLKFKDLVEEGLQRVLAHPDDTEIMRSTSVPPTSVYDLMQNACGVVSSGMDDLATNPKYLSGFGSNSSE